MAEKRLRVASVTYDPYPFDIRVRRLCEAAADAGCEVDVICVPMGDEPSHEVCDGAGVYRLPMHRGVGDSLAVRMVSWTRFMIQAGALLARLHRRNPYDVVQVHNMPDFLVFAALVPRLRGARVILDVQDVSPELMAAMAYGWRKKLLFRLAAIQERVSTIFANHVIVAGGPFEEKLLARGVPARKLSNVINSADPRLFPAARRCPPPNATRDPDQPFIVMYWGTLAERNGVDTAVRAVALACQDVPNLRLDIQGMLALTAPLKRLAEELGIGDHVRFRDSVPSERIVDFVVHGDVGIIPYRCNGFAELVLPTKAYELAWMRRPIIATDMVGIRSMFRPESLLLCTPEDPQSFADAIVALYRDPARAERMVAAAAEDYEKYRWETASVEYTALLARLSGRPSADAPDAPAAEIAVEEAAASR